MLSWGRKTFLTLLAPLFVASCGFEPLYQTGGARADLSSRQGLPAIEVGLIPDSEGVYLRNALMDILPVSRSSRLSSYNLDVSAIEEFISELDITERSDATRGKLRVSVSFMLSDPNGKKLFSRQTSAVTSYNILESEFSNRVSQENARRNALEMLAQQIERQVFLYFQRSNSE